MQVYLAGNMGEALSNESVEAVNKIVDGLPPPPGVKVFVTGGSALIADQQIASDRSVRIIEIVTFAVIITMLLLVYRSIRTVLLVLVMVFLTLSATRGVVAFLGYHELIGLSTFATNLLVTLAIAAATDYAIFLIGRYQEARTIGEDRESAYYTMFHGTAHVVLGSGMTIAGATFCLSFTRLPYFQSLGVPLAVGMTTARARRADVGARDHHRGEPVRPAGTQARHAHSGLAQDRCRDRPLAGSGPARRRSRCPWSACSPCPGYQPNYNDRKYLPPDLPANEGFAAAERHFSPATMNPELLLIESDHDLRNSADFLVIDKIAKAIFRVPGIGRVQAITRPDGKPVEFSTIPAQMSLGGVGQDLNRKYLQDRMADMLVQADEMQTTIDTMTRMSTLMGEMSATTHSMVAKDPRHDRRHRRIAGLHREFRRFLPADPQLLLLGTALLQHPDLLVDAVGVRHARRRRHDDPRRSGVAPGSGAARFADAAADGADAAADRDDEEDEDDDADDARHPGRHAGSAGRACRRTSRPWATRSTTPGTTTRSICRRRSSTTKSSSAAWTASSRRTVTRSG